MRATPRPTSIGAIAAVEPLVSQPGLRLADRSDERLFSGSNQDPICYVEFAAFRAKVVAASQAFGIILAPATEINILNLYAAGCILEQGGYRQCGMSLIGPGPHCACGPLE